MLLAEINGKRNEAIESSEDYLTSAVFGHLRFVKQGAFWRALLGRARSVDGSTTNLLDEFDAADAIIPEDCDLRVLFWPKTMYGEPDLLLRFTTHSSRSVVVIVEVKLYSAKSSVGTDDQLCRYFELLQDRAALSDLLGENATNAEVGLIYLTERFSAAEVLESVTHSKRLTAGRRMAPLQWQDVTEVISDLAPSRDSVLDEVLQFLERRQYIHFRGFHIVCLNAVSTSGHFYRTNYFNKAQSLVHAFASENGRFYA